MPPLRFGRAEIHPDRRQLWVDGQPAVLGSRGFDLLMALVERRERTVSKAELFDLVWAGLVVEDNNLQVQISGLRKLLGNDAIATVPGRGYRFTLVSDDPASVAPGPQPVAESATLPSASDGLFGREDDLVALDRLLAERRLVTVLGAGGIGKTTLAAAAARAQAGRGAAVAWIELAPLADAVQIAGAIAQTMDLPLGPGDRLQALVTSIRLQSVLLVLDNAEHLIEGVAEVANALLRGSENVRLLVTSQAPLKLDDEWLFRLEALAVPAPTASLAEALSHGALALFDARARAADHRFVLDDANLGAAIELCRRLDGLPLAIRLAAARLPVLGLDALGARLAAPLDLLGGGSRSAPQRQQTLRATYDWSHSLLAPGEQMLYRRLGVFVGGFMLESAVALAGPGIDRWQAIDALAVLAERSLVMVDDATPTRYRLLDSARVHALEKLQAAGELAECQRRHAERMSEVLEQSIADDRSDMPDREWMARYPCELDDVRAALRWSEAHDPALALELVAATRTLFRLIGAPHEAWEWLQRLRAFLNADTPPRTRARLADLRAATEQSREAADTDPSAEDQTALADFRLAGDAVGLVLALQDAITRETSSERRQALLAEIHARIEPRWSARLRLVPRNALALVDEMDDRLEAARAGFAACTDEARALGKFHLAARVLVHLAIIESDLGASTDAVAHAREAVTHASVHGSASRQATLHVLLLILLDAGDLQSAREAAQQALEHTRRMGWYRFQPFALPLALLAAMDGRAHAAARLLGLFAAEAASSDFALAHRLRTRAEAFIRAALSDAERDEARAAGARLSPAEASTLALGMSVG